MHPNCTCWICSKEYESYTPQQWFKHLVNARDDAEYFSAIVMGTWPDADKLLAVYRGATIKEPTKQSAEASVSGEESL